MSKSNRGYWVFVLDEEAGGGIGKDGANWEGEGSRKGGMEELGRRGGIRAGRLERRKGKIKSLARVQSAKKKINLC